MTELAYDAFTAAASAPAGDANVVPLRPPATQPPAPAEAGALLARAQTAADAGRLAQAAALLGEAQPLSGGHPELLLRSLFVEGWLALADSRLDEALETLQRARGIAEGRAFSDLDRAEALFRLGACQFERSANAVATSLLTLALELADRSGLPADRVRAHAFIWRARCWQRQRDWNAARADVERAVELAEALGDEHALAHAQVEASAIAEREGQWLLAQYYAEDARRRYAALGDRLNECRLAKNLGGLLFLLGRTGEAVEELETAHAIACELGSEGDAARALSSLAHVHLRTGDATAAEAEALRALEVFAGRVDHLEESGNTRLVLGRALVEQGRFDEAGVAFRAAEDDFEGLGSVTLRAAVWVAKGDLDGRRGELELAAVHYRRAAEALQELRF